MSPFARIKSLFRPSPLAEAARAIHGRIMAAARAPGFFVEGRVPDTVDGRFDLVIAHLFLVMRRLKAEGEAGRELAQRVFDTTFDDFDAAMREAGTGDLSVGPRIRKMAEACYGRIAAYDKAIERSEDAFRTALQRNIYRGQEVDPGALGYVHGELMGFARAFDAEAPHVR